MTHSFPTRRASDRLKVDPVEGSFDVAHLREVHRRIFQDLPHHGPGEFRPPTPGHIKNRVLEGTALRYEVPYATRAEVDARLEPTLAALKSGDARSEERRVGKECFSTCRSGWSPYH